MKRSVPEILKLAANSKYYTTKVRPGYSSESYSSEFMCNVLKHLPTKSLITEAEKYRTLKAINKYLKKLQGCEASSLDSLATALEIAGLPSRFKTRKAIYLDWKNRPKPWKQLT